MSNKSKTNTLAVNDNTHSLVFRIHLNPISSDRQYNKKSFVLYDSLPALNYKNLDRVSFPGVTVKILKSR